MAMFGEEVVVKGLAKIPDPPKAVDEVVVFPNVVVPIAEASTIDVLSPETSCMSEDSDGSATSEMLVTVSLGGSTFFSPNNPRLPVLMANGEELLDGKETDFLERSNAFPSSGCTEASPTEPFSSDSGGSTKEVDFE